MKKFLAMALALGMTVVSSVGCGSRTSETAVPGMMAAQTTTAGTAAADTTVAQTETPAAGVGGPITVISHEDGSGIRGVFIELFDAEVKNDAGEKGDMTAEDAKITDSTLVMITTVAGNMEVVGYVSLGSLNDTVKAVKVDSMEATVDNIESGSYKIAGPFNIATKEDMNEVAADFIKYMVSEEGQKIAKGNGYINRGNEGVYRAAGVSGRIVVVGSSSVTPIMEKLEEAYVALNPDVTTEVQQSDSTTGITSAAEGMCDIDMTSRELKGTELEKGIKGTIIAMGDIVVIVNNDSLIGELGSETVKGIYIGEATDWADAQ